MILSAQSLRNSDIFCFRLGFISCFAIALRWSHDALHRLSIWHRFSWSCSKSIWKKRKEKKRGKVILEVKTLWLYIWISKQCNLCVWKGQVSGNTTSIHIIIIKTIKNSFLYHTMSRQVVLVRKTENKEIPIHIYLILFLEA